MNFITYSLSTTYKAVFGQKSEDSRNLIFNLETGFQTWNQKWAMNADRIRLSVTPLVAIGHRRN